MGHELIIFPLFFIFPAYPSSLAIEIPLQAVNVGFGHRGHLCSDPTAPRPCLRRTLCRDAGGQAVPKAQIIQEKSWSHTPGQLEAAKISPKPICPHPDEPTVQRLVLAVVFLGLSVLLEAALIFRLPSMPLQKGTAGQSWPGK